MKLNRTIKKCDEIWSKIVGKLQRPKEGRCIKKDGPFMVDEPKSLFHTYRTELLAQHQGYRDQYAAVERELRYIQIRRSIVRSEQELIEEIEPLGWYEEGREIDEIWSSQPKEFRNQPSFYDDGFGHIIRVEADDLETIVCNTSAVVVIE